MKFRFKLSRYSPEEEAVYGTILTLGNGHLGVRGEVELEPTVYGTTIAGVYDDAPYFYREIVNAPRVVGLQLMFNGEPLNLSTHRILRYERELDIKKGTLKTWVELETKKGVRIGYESTRIVHGKRKNLVIMKFKFKASQDGLLTILSPIELDTANPSYRGEILVRHYSVEELDCEGEGVYAHVRTLDGRYHVGIASSIFTPVNHERSTVKSTRLIGEVLTLNVEGGKEYEFVKYVVVSSSGGNDMKSAVLEELRESKRAGFEQLYEEHVSHWDRIWERAWVDIEGDEDAERGLAFSLFHLVQSLPHDSHISLTARGIHGFGYRGHVFWDTEIYALPFFMATMPEEARRMLVYRYNNLNAARENARLNGYEGAQFPWESADDGREATPPLVPLDMRGERMVRIYTGEEEHHITADIAYTVDLYYRITGDEEFITRHGLEIILETARFWASRVRYDDGKGYVIEGVIGPDEYHEHVNNSFFTNLMARHNLLLGVSYFREGIGKDRWREVIERTGVTEGEVQKWLEIAEGLYIPPQTDDGVYEEFDGYFALRDYTVDPYGLGEERLPEEIRKDLGRTRLIKQADVIAAQYLLKDWFDLDTIRRNFEYYIVRTTHASSLSMPTYAIVASWLGDMELAYDYFMKCAYIDLKNIYGNTADGFHLATAGGLWQIIFRGFCGVDFKEDTLKISPNLPEKWESVRLRFFFRGSWLELRVKHGEVRIKMLEGTKPIRVEAFGSGTVLQPGEEALLRP